MSVQGFNEDGMHTFTAARAQRPSQLAESKLGSSADAESLCLRLKPPVTEEFDTTMPDHVETGLQVTTGRTYDFS